MRKHKARGYQDRKKFIRDTNRKLRGDVKKRRTWPALETGEYVYSVKNRVNRELKFVVARNMAEAEFIAFPGATHDILRSMSVHAWDSGSLLNPADPNKVGGTNG